MYRNLSCPDLSTLYRLQQRESITKREREDLLGHMPTFAQDRFEKYVFNLTFSPIARAAVQLWCFVAICRCRVNCKKVLQG